MWLAMPTAGFLWFFYFNWTSLAASETQGIDLALLGVASTISFSHAFREDVRTRIPLVSRLGLLLVGASTLYSLMAILVQRVICTTTKGNTPICPSIWTSAFSKWGFLAFAVNVTAIFLLLMMRRLGFHHEYQNLQNTTTRHQVRTTPNTPKRTPPTVREEASHALTEPPRALPEFTGEPVLTVPGITSAVRLPNLVPSDQLPTLIMQTATRQGATLNGANIPRSNAYE